MSSGNDNVEKHQAHANMGANEAKRSNAMATLKIEEEEQEILTFDVSDEALEFAGTVSDKTNFTFGVCTYQQVGCPA
jgi:hypothetical protein